jgi:molybdate transport system substrate-binding protein
LGSCDFDTDLSHRLQKVTFDFALWQIHIVRCVKSEPDSRAAEPLTLPVRSPKAGRRRMPTPLRSTLHVVLFMALGLCGCTSRDSSGAHTLTVFAATSLTDAFTALQAAFNQSQPQVQVSFQFAGTQSLRTQLEHGARADVFASADAQQMVALSSQLRADAPLVFARNALVLVVSKKRPTKVRDFASLDQATSIILGAPGVPIGEYSKQVLAKADAVLGAQFRARVAAKVVSHELNVRQILAKVALGEAEVGIVYRSDTVASANDVTVIGIPDQFNVVAEYPLVVLKNTRNEKAARAFVGLILSQSGQSTLRGFGFLPAEPALE